jgi:hypothetical protein
MLHLARIILTSIQNLQGLLDNFYEQLSLSLSPQASGADASRSIGNLSMANFTTFNASGVSKDSSRMGDVRRHVERLLLRLDFNGKFSSATLKRNVRVDANILAQGGLAK